MDYRTYHLTWMERGKLAGAAVVFGMVVAYLFYDHWGAMCLMPVWLIIGNKYLKSHYQKKRAHILTKQFQDMMQAVCTALLAGLSLENAWKDAEHEMENLYGKSSYIAKELQQMNQSIALRVPMEKVLAEFAQRTGLEDIISFSEVFSFAKRGGGNFVSIIENTTYHMRDKRETEEEIFIMIASKQLEQRIMDVIPLFILAYLKMTSQDYLMVLYGNAFGILFMSICLCCYLLAIWISTRMMNISI